MVSGQNHKNKLDLGLGFSNLGINPKKKARGRQKKTLKQRRLSQRRRCKDEAPPRANRQHTQVVVLLLLDIIARARQWSEASKAEELMFCGWGARLPGGGKTFGNGPKARSGNMKNEANLYYARRRPQQSCIFLGREKTTGARVIMLLLKKGRKRGVRGKEKIQGMEKGVGRVRADPNQLESDSFRKGQTQTEEHRQRRKKRQDKINQQWTPFLGDLLSSDFLTETWTKLQPKQPPQPHQTSISIPLNHMSNILSK